MRRSLAIALGLLAALVLASSAQAYQFTIVTPIPNQQTVQRALSYQLNRQVARHWATIDPVSFVPSGGIPITIMPASEIGQICYQPPGSSVPGGCHWDGGPSGMHIVILSDILDRMTMAISHEIIETEIDGHTDYYWGPNLVEPGDPVAWEPYTILGVYVQDFVYPRWYQIGATGKLDWSGLLGTPLVGNGPVWVPAFRHYHGRRVASFAR